MTFAVYGALGGALFLLPIELQLVAHYSPLESGLALLPLTLVMLAFSARSGQLSARIGPRLQMTLGPFVVGAGLALLTRATEPGSYLTQVLPAVLLFAAGLAIVVAPLTATAMGAAPVEHSGIASAVNNVVARVAGLLAVALLPLLSGLTGAGALGSHDPGHGVPHRHAHLGRRERRWWRRRRTDHPQPGALAGAGTGVLPHLALRRRQPAAATGPGAGGQRRGRALMPTPMCSRSARRQRWVPCHARPAPPRHGSSPPPPSAPSPCATASSRQPPSRASCRAAPSVTS